MFIRKQRKEKTMKATTFNAVMDKAAKMQTAIYEDFANELMTMDELKKMIAGVEGMYECLKFIVELEGVEEEK